MVGIDPGLTGAIGVNGPSGTNVYDMPIVRVHSKGYVDGLALRNLLLELKPDLIVVEMQGVRPGQGISSGGQTMLVYGGIVATAMTIECTLELVAAAKWKRAMGLLGAGKELSRGKALKLYPELRHMLKRKKDHNRAEALLLAAWGHNVRY